MCCHNDTWFHLKLTILRPRDNQCLLCHVHFSHPLAQYIIMIGSNILISFLSFTENLTSSKGIDKILALLLCMHYVNQEKYCVKFYFHLNIFLQSSEKKYTHICKHKHDFMLTAMSFSQVRPDYTIVHKTERVTGRKARGLQTGNSLQVSDVLSLLRGRRKQTSNIFSFSIQI